jgi:hypothetical protein
MNILTLIAGLALLTLGRKLFWLFVGALGFVVAMALASQLLEIETEWVVVLIGLIAGAIGTVLAITLQRVAIGVAGFLAGGYLLLSALNLLGLEPGSAAWQPFLIGGIVGAIAAFPLFEWALIFVSSLAGAFVIAQSFELERIVAVALFVGTVILGVVIQSALRRRATSG